MATRRGSLAAALVAALVVCASAAGRPLGDPTSPSASSSCTSCTLGSICVSELQATDGGGAADHSTSVTTADCSTTVTDVVDTDSEAAVVDAIVRIDES